MFQIVFSYREQTDALIRIQREQDGRGGGKERPHFIKEIENGSDWTRQLSWSPSTIEQRRFAACAAAPVPRHELSQSENSRKERHKNRGRSEEWEWIEDRRRAGRSIAAPPPRVLSRRAQCSRRSVGHGGKGTKVRQEREKEQRKAQTDEEASDNENENKARREAVTEHRRETGECRPERERLTCEERRHGTKQKHANPHRTWCRSAKRSITARFTPRAVRSLYGRARSPGTAGMAGSERREVNMKLIWDVSLAQSRSASVGRYVVDGRRPADRASGHQTGLGKKK